MTDTVRLHEIQHRLDQATPGPWVMLDGWGPSDADGLHRATCIAPRSGPPGVIVLDVPDGVDIVGRREDFEFIAYAPEDIRALLGLTREMAAIIADLANAYNAYVREGNVDALRARNVLSRLADGASE